jgi:hypothetical protein
MPSNQDQPRRVFAVSATLRLRAGRREPLPPVIVVLPYGEPAVISPSVIEANRIAVLPHSSPLHQLQL